jgi:tetratricopeptide (TPR) repeat protein
MSRTNSNGFVVLTMGPFPSVGDATHIQGIIDKGNGHFRDEQYEDALERFKEALAFAPACLLMSQALHILDCVAGIYVKLQQPDQALVHAKAMIRRDRSNARGYLRCGQIMRIQNDPDAAQKWYAQGLKNVKPDDRHRQALASSLEKCQKHSVTKITRSKPCDPFTCLPSEIVSMLLGYFDYKDLLPLLRVCRPWRRFLSSLPILIETIDFSRASAAITLIELRTAVRRLSRSPKEIDITGLTNQARDYLMTRFRDWAKHPSLQRVVLRPADAINISELGLHRHPLRYLFVATEHECLPFSPFGEVLLQCLDLETLIIHAKRSSVYENLHLPESFCQYHLRHLHINTAVRFSSFSCFPNLEILHFHAHAPQLHPGAPLRCDLQLSGNKKLRHVTIQGNDHTASLPSNLEKIVLGTQGACCFRNVRGLEHLSIPVTTDSVRDCSALARDGYFTTIRTLSLNFLHDHGGFIHGGFMRPGLSPQLLIIFNACSQVTTLRLLNVNGLSDDEFGKITANVHDLEAIEITNANITGASLADLLKRPGNRVTSVALSGCHLVSDDTWEWMKQRGIDTHGGQRQYRL